ncbi:heat shock protein [Hydrogenophaga taeniospiralis CCUG 15921]|uniref:Heat shock protein n=1 Tax=Hydrogenophaga taeniospiralis CCUG 15921 TaxID=1281780 RepID=A0A9X4P5D7_9BURK|nr:META domain-containing protein [Hydrogenophaga taeniospiralis]MDG5976708.1 heat shock protein [Hydrogenophaga taeniospiralis CCUG 15921]
MPLNAPRRPAGPRSPLWLALPVLASLVACAVPAAPAATPASAPLVGSEWLLQDLGGRPVLDKVKATLAFPEAGRVTGSGSCNGFFGTYTLIEDRISLGQIGSTRMACGEGVSEQENRYLDALRKAERVEVQGTTMWLHTQGLDKPLRFVRTKP